jgi:hypothetical protein
MWWLMNDILVYIVKMYATHTLSRRILVSDIHLYQYNTVILLNYVILLSVTGRTRKFIKFVQNLSF